MAKNWTNEQRNAFEARDGSILVSAAAGSGKTAVLVERVIQRLTNKEKPCLADSLLIVTFTKAAASEMRDRIAKVLDEKIQASPDDSFLIRQKMLLQSASICTIDSFCGNLVRENFHVLDISPDFKILDQNQARILEEQAISQVLENYYSQNDKTFISLVELLFEGRDDSELANTIMKLHGYSQAYPFPQKWLENVLSGYDENTPICKTPWGKIIVSYALSGIDHCLSLNSEMKKIIGENEILSLAYYPVCLSDEAVLENIRKRLLDEEWDLALSALYNCKFERLPTKGIPKGMSKEPLAEKFKDMRKQMKDIVNLKLTEYMCVTQAENLEDIKILYPLVKKLIACVNDYGEELFKLKKETESYDFSDISHMALSLLVRDENGETVRTPLAFELSEKYVEILIDEYQDTNEAQDMLFRAISKDENNLFRVGDVKQSIYSFRQAMPEIFVSIRNKLSEYKNGNYPAKITLGKNFRSRKGVTSYINYIFSQLMSSEVGGTEYDENEELVAGAAYTDTNEPQAEFHIIDLSSEKIDESDSSLCQAQYTASLVKDIIASQRLITVDGRERPIQYKDICILLRSVKTAGTVFADEFRRFGIPCYTQISGNFFSSTEISLMISLLRVIDNPVQDIPLLSVMMSPIFSFTADEVSLLRINNRKCNLYSCLVKAESDNEKVKDFMRFFRRMRFLASTCTAGELIRRIYEETSYLYIVQAMTEGEIRRANLMLLVDYADVYEKSGMIGLSGFIRFIDKLFLSSRELDASNPVSENADVVKIMTIHKSKGLEFPICILANANKKFNAEDERHNMIISPEYGIGLIRRNEENLSEYKTLSHTAAKISLNQMNKSEELRVLYVALTRAKEDLIIISAIKNLEDKIKKLSSDIDFGKRKLSPFSIAAKNNYSDWIVKSLLRHPDCGELRRLAQIGEDCVLRSDFDLRLKIVDEIKRYSKAFGTVASENETDESFQKFLDERINYKYKYAALSTIPTKRASSQLDKDFIDREDFASSKPSFMEEDNLSGAQRGTAMHRFLQYADFNRANEELEREIRYLTQERKLTQLQAESLNRRSIKTFLSSDVAKRICQSEFVVREKKFTVDIKIKEMYPEIADDFDETLMIQGVLDCAFLENGKLILLDYKTDNIENEDIFREKYASQLKSYKYALQKITEYEVGKTYIYSFKLGKEIEI